MTSTWMREPLVHFAVVGGLLFGAQGVWSRVGTARGTALLSPTELRASRAQLTQELGRAPSSAEAQALTDRVLDEEVLFREALALGLDKDDEIVRRRMVQKMLFFAEDLLAGKDPTDAEAQAWAEAHPDLYRRPERVTFTQLFWDRSRRDAAGDAARALGRVTRGEQVTSDPFALGPRSVDRGPQQLEEQFGPSFAQAVLSAPVGQWVGPFASSLGEHLVRVESHAVSQMPPLEAILARVRGDLIESRRAQARQAMLVKLRAKYGLKPGAEQGLMLPPTLASEESR